MSYLLSQRCPFLWDYPTLDLKFVNNATPTVFLSEITIEVEESSPIVESLFTIQKDVQQRHAGDLILINEGWTDIEKLELRFNIFPGLAANTLEIAPPFKHVINAGPFTERIEIDVIPAFAADGLDVAALICLGDGKWVDQVQYEFHEADGTQRRVTKDELTQREDKALGPFKEWVGTLAGEIMFTSQSDANATQSVKFQAVVYLANENRYGLPRPTTFEYQTSLKSERRGYSKAVPISQELKAGDTDRFSLKIAVPRSSSHQFTLRVRDISGSEIRSEKIVLRSFVPRSVGSRIERSESSSDQPLLGP